MKDPSFTQRRGRLYIGTPTSMQSRRSTCTGTQDPDEPVITSSVMDSIGEYGRVPATAGYLLFEMWGKCGGSSGMPSV